MIYLYEMAFTDLQYIFIIDDEQEEENEGGNIALLFYEKYLNCWKFFLLFLLLFTPEYTFVWLWLQRGIHTLCYVFLACFFYVEFNVEINLYTLRYHN